jgi:bacterioferritin-associated ferredoxin
MAQNQNTTIAATLLLTIILIKIKYELFAFTTRNRRLWMYVCVCHAVTDRQIREAAEGGARTLKDLRRDLGVTRDCGRCASCARECLQEANQRQSKPGKLLRQAA